jgi:hypothetical protein
MAIPSRQIGWGTESNLLWQILKQLNKLTSVLFGLKEAATPNYKVYTALLTQTGPTSPTAVGDLPLVPGITYEIIDNDGGTADFTNVGAPNNTVGTFFVATETTPTSWGDNLLGQLEYNAGAPVAKVLENTIGNVWFTYDGVGNYGIDSNSLFTANKTAPFISGLEGSVGNGGGSPLGGGTGIYIITGSLLNFVVIDNVGNVQDNMIVDYPIEIRVYN